MDPNETIWLLLAWLIGDLEQVEVYESGGTRFISLPRGASPRQVERVIEAATGVKVRAEIREAPPLGAERIPRPADDTIRLDPNLLVKALESAVGVDAMRYAGLLAVEMARPAWADTRKASQLDKALTDARLALTEGKSAFEQERLSDRISRLSGFGSYRENKAARAISSVVRPYNADGAIMLAVQYAANAWADYAEDEEASFDDLLQRFFRSWWDHVRSRLPFVHEAGRVELGTSPTYPKTIPHHVTGLRIVEDERPDLLMQATLLAFAPLTDYARERMGDWPDRMTADLLGYGAGTVTRNQAAQSLHPARLAQQLPVIGDIVIGMELALNKDWDGAVDLFLRAQLQAQGANEFGYSEQRRVRDAWWSEVVRLLERR